MCGPVAMRTCWLRLSATSDVSGCVGSPSPSEIRLSLPLQSRPSVCPGSHVGHRLTEWALLNDGCQVSSLSMTDLSVERFLTEEEMRLYAGDKPPVWRDGSLISTNRQSLLTMMLPHKRPSLCSHLSCCILDGNAARLFVFKCVLATALLCVFARTEEWKL